MRLLPYGNASSPGDKANAEVFEPWEALGAVAEPKVDSTRFGIPGHAFLSGGQAKPSCRT